MSDRLDEISCFVCGARSNNRRFGLSGLTFNELEGFPVICSRCVFRALTGKSAEFSEAWAKYIRDDHEGR